jgi:hypothetical protein
MYSSHDKTKLTGTLRAGEMVTIVAGANVTRQPGRALVKYVPPDDTSLPPLKVGDVVLIYGMKSNGDILLWAKGVWFQESYEVVSEKGACGFTVGYGPGGCMVDIVNDGVSEWWMQVKTKNGARGWVLVGKFDDEKRWYGNFSDVCRLD